MLVPVCIPLSECRNSSLDCVSYSISGVRLEFYFFLISHPITSVELLLLLQKNPQENESFALLSKCPVCII